MFNLHGKVVIVSGASSGIGRQCAITCSEAGAKLVLLGRDEKKLQTTKSTLNGDGHVYFTGDLTDTSYLENVAESTLKTLGAIDGFIHSAGTQQSLPLRLHTKATYLDQFEINALAGFEASRIFTKKSSFNSNGGSIILISSIRGLFGSSNQTGYAASKGAVIAGAKSMAIELAVRNIRVNSISPGMVEGTEMTGTVLQKLPVDWAEQSRSEHPLGWANPKDVAHACVFLLADESAKITGTNLIIDGGFSAR